MTTAEIDAKIAELEKQRKELEKLLEETRSLSPAQQLADLIHSKQCHWNHTDGCGYFYESWKSPGYSRLEYLKKANAMLSEVDFETACKVLKAMSSL